MVDYIQISSQILKDQNEKLFKKSFSFLDYQKYIF